MTTEPVPPPSDPLERIVAQNEKIIDLLDKIRGGVQFFVVLTVITLILQFLF